MIETQSWWAIIPLALLLVHLWWITRPKRDGVVPQELKDRISSRAAAKQKKEDRP